MAGTSPLPDQFGPETRRGWENLQTWGTDWAPLIQARKLISGCWRAMTVIKPSLITDNSAVFVPFGSYFGRILLSFNR